MRKVLPSQFEVDSEALEVMVRSVREFASAVSCEALTMGALDHKSRIGGFEVMTAAEALGFDQYEPAIKAYLVKRQTHVLSCNHCATQTFTTPHPKIHASSSSRSVPSDRAGMALSLHAQPLPQSQPQQPQPQQQQQQQKLPEPLPTPTVARKAYKPKKAAKSAKTVFSDPVFLAEAMATVRGCPDQAEMFKALAKQFKMPIKEVREKFGAYTEMWLKK